MATGSLSVPAARLTTNIVGGLGNQLFLMANLLATSRRTGIPAYVEPVSFSSSAEAPRPTYWDSLFCQLDQHGVRLESPLASSLSRPVVPVPEVRPVRKLQLDGRRACVYNMVGFFQCAEFFDDYPVMREVIPRHLWAAAGAHLQRHYWHQSEDCAANAHTVAVHVRRGDYTRFADVFEQLQIDYYDAAVRQLLGGLLLHHTAPAGGTAGAAESARPHILIFCDELRAAQTIAGFFRVKYAGVRVSVVHPDQESDGESSSTLSAAAAMPRDVLELLMMAQCSDVVMANSTFSWWGAYLNAVPLRRVVAPSRWFVKDPYPASNHLYCPGWMLI